MSRSALLRAAPLLAATLVAPAFALAANSANLATQQDMRSIAIQNWGSANITQALVKTTDGKVWNLGQGEVGRNQASEIIVPARDCIAAVSVTFKDGRHLQADHLHACDNTQIVVRDDRISIPQQAVPGARQHATPG
jgi:hypothetical protein